MRLHIQPEDVEAARCGVARSSRWPRIEKLHLSLQPKCACCGDKMDPHAGMQVHHIFPFHYCIALGRPDLELDLRNLITLCENEPGQPAGPAHGCSWRWAPFSAKQPPPPWTFPRFPRNPFEGTLGSWPGRGSLAR